MSTGRQPHGSLAPAVQPHFRGYSVPSNVIKLLVGTKTQSHDVSTVEIYSNCLPITTVPQLCDSYQSTSNIDITLSPFENN